MREGVDDPYEAMLFLNNSKTPKKVIGNNKKIVKEESKNVDSEVDDEDYNKALTELRKLRENALDKR